MLIKIFPVITFILILISSCSEDPGFDSLNMENTLIETRSDDCFDEAYDSAGQAISDCFAEGGSDEDCYTLGDEVFYDQIKDCD